MFTGIITDIGMVQELHRSGNETQLRITTGMPLAPVEIGASIACNGICLTVCSFGENWFTATASAETDHITTLSDWQIGTAINLERALKMGDELGGHLVSGHIDGCATLQQIKPTGESYSLTLQTPPELSRFIARKGSVALDGISLTVNHVTDSDFTVMIIPHTWDHTTLSQRQVGDTLNLEVDLFARYLERLQEKG